MSDAAKMTEFWELPPGSSFCPECGFGAEEFDWIWQDHFGWGNLLIRSDRVGVTLWCPAIHSWDVLSAEVITETGVRSMRARPQEITP